MVVVTEYMKTDDKLILQLEDCDICFVNALRRIVLTQIKCIVFRGFPHEQNNINITKNNTKFNNEYIKHRISCVPILYNKIDKFSVITDKYYVKVHLKNETNEKIILTTDHFKLLKKKDNTESKLDKPLFHTLPIPIIYLYPQVSTSEPFEEFEANIDLCVGSAKEDSCWNMVSKCLYYHVENEEKVQEQLEHIEREDLGEEDKQLKKNDFKVLDAQKKEYCYENKYHFELETIGVYENDKIINMACDYLIQQLKQLSKDTDTPILNTNLLMKENDSTLIFINEEITNNIKYRIQIQKDDYTIGKLIEKYAYTYFNSKNGLIEKLFKYISFKKEHPHDEHSIIYIIYESESNTDSLFKHLKMIYELIIKDFESMKEIVDK